MAKLGKCRGMLKKCSDSVVRFVRTVMPEFIPLFLGFIVSGLYVLQLLRYSPDAIPWSIVVVLSTNMLIAMVSAMLCAAFSKKMRSCVFGCIIFVSGITAALEGLLLYFYQLPLSPDVMTAVLCTNVDEASGMARAYLSPATVAVVTALLAAVLSLQILLRRYLERKAARPDSLRVAVRAAVLGLLFAVLVVCGSLWQYSTGVARSHIAYSSQLARVVFSLMKNLQGEEISRQCYEENARFLAGGRAVRADADSVSFIFVLGESFSKRHCSMYGYDKQTYPRLQKYRDNGQLAVFTDAVALDERTVDVLKRLFSFDGRNDNLLLPAVLKRAGFHNYMYDNEYLTSDTLVDWWYTNKRISELFYDYRNDTVKRYDGELVNSISVSNERLAFYFINLIGQHNYYCDRYPRGFTRYTAAHYPMAVSPAAAKQLADYDNACLYNDRVMCGIIDKFAHKNAVLLYISDHGEEVYDYRDFSGHGSVTANHRSIPYQIEIPMMIWMSSTFKSRHPDVARRVSASVHRPFISSRTSYLILDLLQVGSDVFDSRRSVISDDYDVTLPRIVVSTIDYDASRACGFTD